MFHVLTLRRHSFLVTALATLGASLAGVFIATSADAQTLYDRKAMALSILEDATGQPTVHAWGTIQVADSSVPADLSTDLELLVNGLLVDSASFDITIDGNPGGSCSAGPPCNGSCGSGSVNGQNVTLRCFKDCVGASCDCTCGLWISAELNPTVPIVYGDEIMVILRPAPGAVPETDTADDACVVRYAEQQVYWNRRIDSVQLVPVPGGGNVYDVEVDGYVEYNGAPGRDLVLDIEAELVVNGTIVAVVPGVFEAHPPYGTPDDYAGYCVSGCIATCGYVNALPATCSNGPDCACGSPLDLRIPGQVLDPTGDEIMVILRPAPGTLPELPPFEDDDSAGPNTSAGVESDLPTDTRLLTHVGPNPARGSATVDVSFRLASPEAATIAVFDAGGKRVRSLLDARLAAGEGNRSWDGRNDLGQPVPSGVYWVRLRAGQSEDDARIVWVR
ncbi:MAG: hypothetical protein KC729_07600 [Candidatus Eisenbacteria bacterium]|uniref:FlgD/Vpr Ig-like domain-containing protein n=1 Tax=Eiseniibacteriota bacterium TaxID=2212470 RepID=A0A956LYV7_UNCEI|nr:hypothetical protein [Candidatus Eisenbacteria bacterium]